MAEFESLGVRRSVAEAGVNGADVMLAGVAGNLALLTECGGFSMTRQFVWVPCCAERSYAPTVLGSG